MKLFGELYERRMIKTWLRDRPEGWRLASGAWSPFYFMFREVPFYPGLFEYCTQSLADVFNEIKLETRVDCLIGLASTGIPLGAALAHQLKVPFAFNRKISGVRTVEELKQGTTKWGDHSMVEGAFADGMNYLFVDDVVTGGASKKLAQAQVDFEAERRGINLNFAGTIVVVDRGFPGHDNSQYKIHAKHRFYDDLPQILDFGATEREVEVIRKYLENPEIFQNEESIDNLMKETAAKQLV